MPTRTTTRAKRANGEGSVTWNKARRRWEARVTDDGTRRCVGTARTQREALAKLRAWQSAAAEGLAPAPATLTVTTFLRQWLANEAPSGVTAKTLADYTAMIDHHIVPHIGLKHLRTLTPRDVSAMMRAMEAQGKSPHTIKLVRSVLVRAIGDAEREGLVVRNSARLARGPRIPRPARRAMTPEQARTFLHAVKGDEREALWVLLITSGLRTGEALALSWSDVNFASGTVTVTRGLVRRPELALTEPKTDRSNRTVKLASQALESLRAHKARQEADRLSAGDLWIELPLGADLVFRTAHGEAQQQPNRHLRKITLAAGLGEWTPHELRHSAASLMIHSGTGIFAVSRSLGHSNISQTSDVYGHMFTDGRDEVARGLERILGE